MQITDLLGGTIIVTDLKTAIAQVETIIDKKPKDPATYPSIIRFDQRRLEYWNDMRTKLLQLQSEINNDQNLKS